MSRTASSPGNTPASPLLDTLFPTQPAQTKKSDTMKIGTSNSKSFESHPEYSGPAVCVDVTPLKTVQTDYGPKEQFKLVFETNEKRQDGKPYLVWSRGFTPYLGEKAALRSFLKYLAKRDIKDSS